MVIVSEPIKIDNQILIEPLKKYIQLNKCCSSYPNCEHPKIQSDPRLFEFDCSAIKKLAESYYQTLQQIMNKEINILENRSWVFLNEANTVPELLWHNHCSENKYERNTIHVSGIYYVTPTKVGTMYKNDFMTLETIPRMNRWYIWESSISHTPKDVVTTDERIVVATHTVLCQ